MRQIAVTNLGDTSSIIGMGCASLGSRVGRREGLRALERAFDAGITWFDVAPSYGDAEAETIVGEFARGKRDKLKICTKVGIRPARTPFAMRAVKPFVRSAVGAVPMLRKYAIRARPVATKLPITAETISTSIEASLKRLGTDHVDALALHDAEPQEVVRDDIIAGLERVVSLGKSKVISIASSLASGLCGVAYSNIYSIIQVANNPFQPCLAQAAERSPAGRQVTFVTHSAYGAFGALSRLRQSIELNTTKRQMLLDYGYRGNAETVAAAFLADYALSTNRAGVTLFSMLKQEHLDFNLRRLERTRAMDHMEKLARVLTAI